MTINKISSFDRKHYFYPDLPLGYQITQFYHPIAEKGFLPIWVDNKIRNVAINRIHLETDAGKSIHKESETLIDLNRCGVPLMEIVTEPDIYSADEAAVFFRLLQATLRKVGSCDGNMEAGNMRADVNISVHKEGTPLGTRVEIKNLNSVRFMKKAIAYEFQRQVELIENGGTITQETRLFREDSGETFHMRNKEDSSDYRYMPDPDLTHITIKEEQIDKQKDLLPTLPYEICESIHKLGVSYSEAWTVAESEILTKIFLEASETLDQKTKNTLFKWIIGDLAAYLKENETDVNPIYLRNLIIETEKGSISGKTAKEVLIESLDKNLDPIEIIKSKGLSQINSADDIQGVVEQVIKENPKEVEAYKSGKTNLKQFFVGQVMKKTSGKANPSIILKAIDNIF